jgi:VWFA-related protein
MLPWLVMAWSTGVVVFSARIALGWRMASRLRQAASGPVPLAWRQALQELKLRMRVSAPARLLASSLTTAPAVVGWLRPVILMPVAAMTGMPMEHVRALLAHELAHILRQDYLVNILQSMAEALLFYHPAVWWVSNQIRVERESCCDDLAVEACGDVLAYATALADLDAYRRARLRLAQAADGGPLLHRIRRLVGEAEPLAHNLPGVGAVSALAALWMAGLGAATLHAVPVTPAPAAHAALRPFVPAGVAAAPPVLLEPPPKIRVQRAPRVLSALLFDPFLARPQAPGAPAQTVSDAAMQFATPAGTAAGNSEKLLASSTVPPSRMVGPLVAEPLATTHTATTGAVAKSPSERLAAPAVVEVSIVATDAKGAPAEGLDATDFRAWDNGTEQTIASVKKVGRVAASAPAALPPDQPRILSMVLLDAVNTTYSDQLLAWRAVENVVEQLPAEEPVAVYSLGSGYGLGTVRDFPADGGSLLANLSAHLRGAPGAAGALEIRSLTRKERPAEPFAPPSVQALRDKERILNTLLALETIAGQVKDVPGRKNLLWVSGAFPMTVGDQRSLYFEHFEPELARAVAVLNNAHVSVYPIDTRGLSTSSGAVGNIATMKSIAEATGGRAFYNRNDVAQGVRAALDDSHEAYLLTYAPQPLAADGAYHTIRLANSRRGVHLRYRRGYDAPNKGETEGAETEGRSTTAALLLDASQTGIRASVEPGQGEGRDVSVAIHIDSADLNLAPNDAGKWTGALRLEAMQLGASGEALGGIRQAAEINLGPATYRLALRQGLEFDMKFQRQPAAVAVRVGVVDECGGQVGSLSVPLPPDARSPGQ